MKTRKLGLTFVSIIMMSVMMSITVYAQSSASQTAKKKLETSLIGVKLYDSVDVLLKKFGNPQQIIPLVYETLQTGAGSGAPGEGGGFGAPQGGPVPGGGPAMGAPMPGGPMPGGASAGGPMPGGPMPGGPGGGGAGSGTVTTGNATVVMYIYILKGKTYTFIINDVGKVSQISAIAWKDSNVKTAKGITLGMKYADVIKKYGYPESHEFTGTTVTLKYLKSSQLAFELFNHEKQGWIVVGVTIATGHK